MPETNPKDEGSRGRRESVSLGNACKPSLVSSTRRTPVLDTATNAPSCTRWMERSQVPTCVSTMPCSMAISQRYVRRNRRGIGVHASEMGGVANPTSMGCTTRISCESMAREESICRTSSLFRRLMARKFFRLRMLCLWGLHTRSCNALCLQPSKHGTCILCSFQLVLVRIVWSDTSDSRALSLIEELPWTDIPLRLLCLHEVAMVCAQSR